MIGREDVLRQIEQAFADARMPRTEGELTEGGIDGPYVIKHFFGKTREDVETQEFLGSLYMEDFTYMTDGAVLYYLPPVLRIMLADPIDSELWIFLHGFLRHVKGKYPYPGLSVLSAEQRRAIADWAEHLGAEWELHAWMSKFASEAAELSRTYRLSCAPDDRA